ncbi:DEAD/DEAH box helicase [Paenibacillus sp. strain BS8-2]
MNFNDLRLIPEILKALREDNLVQPTPIQEQAIPIALLGNDVLGCAQTGTGKTAAFSLPIIQRLYQEGVAARDKQRPIRSLILTPTRELAIQIEDNIRAYGKYTGLRTLSIVGGVSQKGQERHLEKGIDILIATPGRLMDLMNQGFIDLLHVQVLVLDEADRMLDMGFINDVKRIIAKLPSKKQTMLFSATMPPEIAKLADSLLVNAAKLEITPASSTVDLIEQSVYFVDKTNKPALLAELLADTSISSALVFTRTKHGADRVARGLNRANITAQAIHGDKSQNQRQNALNNFKSGATRILVATDIAARGIDIEELSHVYNFNLPNIPETYVHRIGRTGRAGHSGVAVSFCDEEEQPYLKDIEKLIKKKISVVVGHSYPMQGAAADAVVTSANAAAKSGQGNRSAKAKQPAAAQGGGQQPARAQQPAAAQGGGQQPARAKQPAAAQGGGQQPARAKQPAAAQGGGQQPARAKQPAAAQGGGQQPARAKQPAAAQGDGQQPARAKQPAAAQGGGQQPARAKQPAAAQGGGQQPARAKQPAAAQGGGQQPARAKQPAAAQGGGQQPARAQQPAAAQGGGQPSTKPKRKDRGKVHMDSKARQFARQEQMVIRQMDEEVNRMQLSSTWKPYFLPAQPKPKK